MKQIISILASVFFSVGAFAAHAIPGVQMDSGVEVLVCGASTIESEAALGLEGIVELSIYAIDVLSGDEIDAGHFSSPFALKKISSVTDANGLVTNTYDVVDSIEKATVVFEVGASAAEVKIVSVMIGTSIFLAPVLVKDQANTDSIVKAGNAGFSCSAGTADVLAPISDLAF